MLQLWHNLEEEADEQEDGVADTLAAEIYTQF